MMPLAGFSLLPGDRRDLSKTLGRTLRRRRGCPDQQWSEERQTLALAKQADHPLFSHLQGLRESRHQVVSI